MQSISNTSELAEWFNHHQDVLKQRYAKQLEETLTLSMMIKKSLAYHAIKELALQENYYLTDCQINKLIFLLTI